MRSLYDIKYELEDCLDMAMDEAENNNGVISDTLASHIDALEMERGDKIENVALWVKNLKAESEMISNEIKSLQERKKTTINKMESVKNTLARYLEYGLEKFKTGKVSISWRKSESVIVNCDVLELPEEYQLIKIEPSKSNLKIALKNGKEIKGVCLETKKNIQIK